MKKPKRERGAVTTTKKLADKTGTGIGRYYVYILLCDDGSYYTGYTKNVALRFEKHKKGRGARYTKMHRPKKVVHVEEFKTRRNAIRRELEIKALNHGEKHDLVSVQSQEERWKR
jgi:putative endonuclease